MDWTRSQRDAIETRGRRVIVNAGAGSGKTRVLVERFLLLLEENPEWRVSDIVAVTFTEKAAREMVSRIRREIRSRIQSSPSADDRMRWREHRNALDSSRIGTIHSLCAWVLRAHPAEAGLDPAFEVIEEVEAAALLEQAIKETIARAARESDPADLNTATAFPAPVDIFERLSTYDVQTAIKTLIAQGEKARQAISRNNGSDSSAMLAFWQKKLLDLKAETARALIERDDWKQSARTILQSAAIKPDDKREQCRAEVAARLKRVENASGPARSGALIAGTLLEIASAVNLRGGSKKNWASEEEFEAVKDALSQMRESVRAEKILALELNEADQVAAQVAAQIIKLYETTRERFARLKSERNALDFNDLEEITERMLAEHCEVRERFTDADRGLVRALMVDEFQDTSPIQKRLLWMIAPRSNELFIIGDEKQSIYKFRGADVSVFQGACRELASSDGIEIGMDACFRTHERLIDFVNHLFPQIFTRESLYDTPYERMSAARTYACDRPSVELHILGQNDEADTKLSADRLREAEAALIADRIEEITRSGEIVVCDRDGNTRRAEYNDFAMLFQASTSFEIYERALADRGIPYVTIAGRGFYGRQEITDITNLLAFLASPIDSLHLASALRSPMFSLSDETLLNLRLDRKHGSLWEALLDESIVHAEPEKEAVEFARASLARLKEMVGRMSAAELIVAALKETGYLATLMAFSHGERRVANVEKLIEQTRELQSLTLSEVVKRAVDLKFKEAREGEATIEEEGAVRLMTIHKSKGLEFPIVWLADATYRGASDRSIVAAHPDYGISVNITAQHLETDDERLRASSFEMLRQVENRMERAEKKRLLYVAITRARDHLIISGAINRARASGDDWLSRLMRALGVDQQFKPRSVDYPGGAVEVNWREAEEILNRSLIDRAINQDKCASENKAAPDKACARQDQQSMSRFPLIGPLASDRR